MKGKVRNNVIFFAKSFAWAVLLFALLMFVFNRDSPKGDAIVISSNNDTIRRNVRHVELPGPGNRNARVAAGEAGTGNDSAKKNG